MHITHVNLQGIPFLAPNTSLDFLKRVADEMKDTAQTEKVKQ